MTSEQKKQYLSQFHKFQLNREQHFAPKVYKALRNQYFDFIAALKNGRSTPLMQIDSNPMRALIKTLYIDAGTNYGSLIYSQLPKAPNKLKRRAPLGFNEEMIELINQWFEVGWLNTAEGITNTTRELIQVVMEIATEEGRDLDWIVNQLENESIDISRNRSRLIARTETVTASNQAAFFAAAKTGLLMKKIWLATQDSRVRDSHELVNGSTVGMEDFFIVGGETLLLPGARQQSNGLPTSPKNICNCRCVCLYEAVRNAIGKLVEFDYQVWNSMAA